MKLILFTKITYFTSYYRIKHKILVNRNMRLRKFLKKSLNFEQCFLRISIFVNVSGHIFSVVGDIYESQSLRRPIILYNICSLYNNKKFTKNCFQTFKIAFQIGCANSIARANSIAPTLYILSAEEQFLSTQCSCHSVL